MQEPKLDDGPSWVLYLTSVQASVKNAFMTLCVIDWLSKPVKKGRLVIGGPVERREASGLALRRPIPDEEAAAIAIARYSEHPPKSLKELSDQFSRNQETISRTISRALNRGLVEVTPARHLHRAPRATELEEQIRERYKFLASCIVLRSEQVTPLENDPEIVAMVGDRLHRELGYAAAAVIGEGSFFRDGDVIGLGSGRGVFNLIQGLYSYKPIGARVSLCSLTGQVYATDHGEQLNLLLDADIHLGLLGPRFRFPVTIQPMSNSIVCSRPEEAREVLARWEEDQSRLANQGTRPGITHALLGVGVLTRGHRFYKEVKMGANKRTPSLRPIEHALERLVRVCDEESERSKGTYCPAADIVNRLFFVPPSPSFPMREEDVRALENRVSGPIREINERVVAVTDAQLRKISNITLVAGSRMKGAAVRKLLKERYPIKFLCICQQIAEELLLPEAAQSQSRTQFGVWR
jgi:DNA-binding transcriptional regulator LsrR (DeoR family)